MLTNMLNLYLFLIIYLYYFNFNFIFNFNVNFNVNYNVNFNFNFNIPLLWMLSNISNFMVLEILITKLFTVPLFAMVALSHGGFILKHSIEKFSHTFPIYFGCVFNFVFSF